MEASGRAVPIFEPAGPPQLRRPQQEKASRVWLLWTHRKLLWSVTWKAAILSAIFSLFLPTHYQATVKVALGDSSRQSMAALSTLAGATGSFGLGMDAAALLGMKTPGAFYVEILKSRRIQDHLLDRFDLRRHYWKLGRFSPRDYYNTRKKLAEFTEIDEDKKSGVISVSVKDYDPTTAARIANAYIEELNRLAADLDTSEAHRERVFLEERLSQAKHDLDQASLDLSRFSSKNSITDPNSQGKAMVESAARIQGELVAAETELRGLEQIYSDNNVRVRTLTARINELREQLRKLSGTDAFVGENSEAGFTEHPSFRKLPGLNYQYMNLYRQAKVQETVYEFLTQQYEMARIQEARELPTVRVVDPAMPPERKSGPYRSLIVISTVVCAFFLACFWVLGKNAWEEIPLEDPRRLVAAEARSNFRKAFSRTRWRRND
ncbi:MAG TPA: GNVR domain-containing protein [Terriglobales bacterium]|nr:GNVR domain-containing protein [Terriglobales bacterium]